MPHAVLQRLPKRGLVSARSESLRYVLAATGAWSRPVQEARIEWGHKQKGFFLWFFFSLAPLLKRSGTMTVDLSMTLLYLRANSSHEASWTDPVLSVPTVIAPQHRRTLRCAVPWPFPPLTLTGTVGPLLLIRYSFPCLNLSCCLAPLERPVPLVRGPLDMQVSGCETTWRTWSMSPVPCPVPQVPVHLL